MRRILPLLFMTTFLTLSAQATLPPEGAVECDNTQGQLVLSASSANEPAHYHGPRNPKRVDASQGPLDVGMTLRDQLLYRVNAIGSVGETKNGRTREYAKLKLTIEGRAKSVGTRKVIGVGGCPIDATQFEIPAVIDVQPDNGDGAGPQQLLQYWARVKCHYMIANVGARCFTARDQIRERRFLQ